MASMNLIGFTAVFMWAPSTSWACWVAFVGVLVNCNALAMALVGDS